MFLATRSRQEELLDAPHIQPELLHQNLAELDTINRYLGGHAATVSGVARLLAGQDKSRTWHIVDLGCGGGDTLRILAQWGQKQGWKLRLTGLDLNAECIAYARKACAEYPEIDFVCADFAQAPQLFPQADICITALFSHHIYEETLLALLRVMSQARLGYVNNDLHRHPLAWGGIWLLTRLFSGSPLVKNDAPLSVARGFRYQEWRELYHQAGLPQPEIRWVWAFRWRVLGRTSLGPDAGVPVR